MKQKLLNLTRLRSLLLMACVMLGVSAWGQSDYSSDYTGNITLSAGGISNTQTCIVKINNIEYSGLKAGTSNNAGSIKITVPSGTKYLHLHAAGWNNETVKLKIQRGNTDFLSDYALTSNSGISGNSPFTFNESSTAASSTDYYKVITFSSALTQDIEFTFTATTGKRFVVWGVTAEEENSGPADPQIAFNPATVTINQGETLPSISFLNPNSVSNITFTSNNAALATVSNAGEISLEPDATGTATITASFAGNDSYAAKTVTCVITVIPVHTAHFFVNGVEASSDDFAEGAAITFPTNPSAINNKVFMGWTTTQITVEQNNAPEMVTSATMGNEDVTFYAVFASQEGATSTATLTESEITSNFTNVAMAYTGNEKTYNDNTDGIIWTVKGYATKDAPWIQLRKNATAAYLKINAPGNISNLSFTISNTTTATGASTSELANHGAFTGSIILLSSASGNASEGTLGSTNSINNYEATITPTSNVQEIYVQTTGAARIWGVEVTFGSVAYSNYCTIVPCTVAQALQTPDETVVYVSGIVSRVDSYNTNNHTMNYWISDDGTNTNRLGINFGKGVNGADFSSISDVRIGDVVVLRGTLATFNGTKELQNSQIVTLTVKPEPGIAYETASYTVGYNAAFATPVLTNRNGVTVTYSSDNQGVATVHAETGVVTILSTAGTATVTATYAGGEYRYATASYTITVEPKIYITMNADGIMTYATTYGLDFSEVEGLTAYFAEGYNKDNLSLTMTEVTYTAPGAGMMLKGEAEHVYLVPIATEGSTTTANLLVGLTEATTVSQVQTENDETYYTFILAKVNNVINWYKLAEESYPLRANIAYLKLPAAAIPSQPETDQVIMDFSGGSNGISTATATATNNESWYTLDGRLLQGKPATKGIYVNNGRKIVIK